MNLTLRYLIYDTIFMFPIDFFSGVLVILVAALLVYRSSLLSKKAIWHLSMQQILYLVILPGILFIVFFSYIQTVLDRPFIPGGPFSDLTLVNIVMLSILFAYGGTAIHAVTKMLSETSLRHEHTEAAEINRYFHRKFSHNLMYSGCISIVIGMTLLELNHTPVKGYEGWRVPIIQGFIAGAVLIGSMYHYTRSRDNYTGRWADLKAVFLTLWIGLVLLLYSVWRLSPSLKEYQLLIPVLSGLVLIGILNMGLIIRRMRKASRSAV